MVSANGAAPVMAIIEDLTIKSCRLRSMNHFNIGDTVLFDFVIRGARKVTLSGKVLTCTQNEVRRTYTVALHETDEDAIISALDCAQRWSVERPTPEAHTGTGLTRSSTRVPVDIALEYRTAGSAPRAARATNISTGGVLMNSDDDIAVGTAVELRLRLPNGTRHLIVQARIVAHQHRTPNYNMAFFSVAPDVKADLEAFVSLHAPK